MYCQLDIMPLAGKRAHKGTKNTRVRRSFLLQMNTLGDNDNLNGI